MATKPLFPAHAKSAFLRRTRVGYADMRKRAKSRGAVVPFPLACFRAHVLMNMLGDHYDGIAQCPHCFRILDISEVAFDHAIPLSRGGSWGLDNIAGTCGACNAQKIDLTPQEFNDLLSFLEKEIPYARTTFLKQRQEYSKLLASKRAHDAQKNSARGKGFTRKTKPPLVAAIEQVF